MLLCANPHYPIDENYVISIDGGKSINKLQINVIPPSPRNLAFYLTFKTNNFYSSGAVIGRAVGAYAGDTRLDSRPGQD